MRPCPNTTSTNKTSSQVQSTESLSHSIHNSTIPLVLNINDYPMLTISKIGHSKPKALLTHVEPTFVKQTVAQTDWHKSMKLEYDTLMANQSWTLTTLLTHRNHVGCRRVFKVKDNVDGTVNKYKARLVAKGYHQQFGFYFKETFSPVVKGNHH